LETSGDTRSQLVRQVSRRVALRPRASAAVLLVLLLAATAFAVRAAAGADRHESERRVAHDAAVTISTLEQRIGAYTEVLVGLRGLFELDTSPSRERFGRFVRGLQLPARYPGVQTVSFAEAIDPTQRADFTRRITSELLVTSELYPPFSIHPRRDDRQVVIDYLEPPIGNNAAFGYDLLSQPARAAAVRQTQLTGRPAMTAPINLIQDGRRGFLIMLAVRSAGDVLVTSSAGRFRGVTTAAFHADEFLRGALPPATAGLDFEIYDVGASASPTSMPVSMRNLLFDADGDHAALQPIDRAHESTTEINVAGRRWLVYFAPPVSATSAVSLPLVIGAGGIAGSILASWLLLSLGMGRTRAVELAQAMTEELRQAQIRFRTAFDDAPIGMALVSPDGHWLEVNHALCRILRYSQADLESLTFQDLTLPEDLDEALEDARRLLAGETTGYTRDKSYVRGDGTVAITNLAVSLVRDATGEPLHFIAQIEDITHRRRADQRFRDLLESAPDAMVIVDAEGRIVHSNSQTERLFGYTPDELAGERVEMLVPDRFRSGHDKRRASYDDDPHARPMGAGLDLAARRKDGSEFPVEISLAPLETEDGRLVSAAIRDVTTRKVEEEQLRYLAEHDELTGLRNRRTFEADLARETARSRRYREGAMLLIDIDSLKDVNDTLGHGQGDELIRSVGALIASRVRSTDMVARIGGDEFAVLMPDTPVDAARVVAEELLQSIRDHGIVLGAQRQRLTASMGLAAFGTSGPSVGEDVMVAADLALYEAKENGRDRAVVYAPAAPETARRQARIAWSQRLRGALDENLLVAYQQPIMTLGTRAIEQYELLVRMLDANGSPIPPSAFMPTAERTGLVREIDRYMIGRAIDLIAGSQQTTYEVNLSARSLVDPELPAIVSEQLTRTGADPSRLVFEITETAAIANMEQARAFANALRNLGCGFALDDFGAGFASFYYLKHMPLDFLKIDGDFVRNITTNPTDQLVVSHIAQIASSLGLQTIAEFVENEATLELLADLGVDHVQGYHVGRPVPVLGGAPSSVPQ